MSNNLTFMFKINTVIHVLKETSLSFNKRDYELQERNNPKTYKNVLVFSKLPRKDIELKSFCIVIIITKYEAYKTIVLWFRLFKSLDCPVFFHFQSIIETNGNETNKILTERLNVGPMHARQDGDYSDLIADRALDRKIYPLSDINNCAHSVGYWWILDMVIPYTVAAVVIYKRESSSE